MQVDERVRGAKQFLLQGNRLSSAGYDLISLPDSLRAEVVHHDGKLAPDRLDRKAQ
jgi:hypothetical protein